MLSIAVAGERRNAASLTVSRSSTATPTGETDSSVCALCDAIGMLGVAGAGGSRGGRWWSDVARGKVTRRMT